MGDNDPDEIIIDFGFISEILRKAKLGSKHFI
jgi:hypothetical protein